MTNGASLGDVFRIHRRTRLGARDELVNIAVTARASRRLFKTLGARLCVNTLGVSFHAGSMAGRALYGLHGSDVRHLRNIAVAGRALERTMD